MGNLEAVFQWIIESSVMASVLVGVILAVKLIFKNKLSANWHYYIWFLLLLRLLIPYGPESSLSIFNVVNPYISYINNHSSIPDKRTLLRIQKNKEQSSAILKQSKVTNIHMSQSIHGYTQKLYEPSIIKTNLIILWLLGVTILTIYMIIINRKILLRIKINRNLINESVNQVLDECKSIMNIQSNIPIVFTATTNPCLFGFIRPRLLLPTYLIGRVNNNQLKHIFLHELAHFKRKDIIVNWVMVLLQIIHWFNPIIWYGFYKMHYDCEIACDSLALSYIKQEERKEYGHTIIHLLKIISTPKWIPGTTGILTGKSQIKRRITMISLFKKKSLQWTIAAIILFLVIGFAGLTNAKHREDIQVLQQSVHTNNIKYKDLEKQMKKNQIIAGMTDVEGKGIVVTLDDKKLGDKESKIDNMISVVNIVDIHKVINELTNDGAEAISVNNERIVANSKITCDGMRVVINGNRYTTNPFVIKAIGDSEKLSSYLNSNVSIIRELKDRGIVVKIEKADKVIISKMKNDIQFKYAIPVEEGKSK